MAFLLLLVSLSFALIFSVFSSQPSSLESFLSLPGAHFFPLLFTILWISWFSYFFFIVWKDKQEEKTSIDFVQARDALLSFFRDKLYYIWFIFLYAALYFIIGPSVGYDFWIFIFVISFLILILFFLSEKFSLFRDLIKINTILFSLYYIICYVIIFISWNDFFWLFDLLNQIFILAFFVLNIYNDKTLLKNKVNDTALIGYGFSYLLLFLVFYMSKWGLSPWLWFTYLWTILSFILKNFITDFSFFKWNAPVLKTLSIIFGYMWLLCAIIYFILHGFNVFAFIAALYLIIDNIVIHNYFQNYISLLLSLWAILFFYGYFYFSVLMVYEIDGYIFLFYGYLLYFWAITLGYIQRFNYEPDYYFIYWFFYLASLVSMVYFLFSFRFELFDFWVMLLLQSIITFMVYYQFNRLKTHDS